MNFLFILGQVLLYTFLLGLFIWGMKNAVSFYVFSKKREQINKLNARISILKLHLKGKIKRKCNKIESLFKKSEDAETLNILRPKLSSIQELTFTLTSDYQKLIDILTTITVDIEGHIKLKHKDLIKKQEAQKVNLEMPPPTEDEIIKEKCKKLIKYDKAHMLIVIEIIQATEDLIEKTNEFNALAEFEKNQKKIKEIPNKIEIENYSVIAELVELSKTTTIDTPDFPILEKSMSESAA